MANLTPTPHNEAKLGDFAKTVLMPGDPLRVKYIAEEFLEDARCVNTVRNILAYTGKYKGKEISVMAGGMGNPSVGIYTYELFNCYDVDNIIRIGSAGAIADGLKLKDLVIAMGSCYDTNYDKQFNIGGTYSAIASYKLLKAAEEKAAELGVDAVVGNTFATDMFYDERYNDPNANKLENWRKMGILCCEMEAPALYMNAARAGKNALCMISISDMMFTGEKLSADERKLSFANMMKVALEVGIEA
ncbi:MAG: purine-nucleoside phosphorylase [Clostridia bacterium]|nr:purine-nucleoside phosphorylase [Clostridia bacterium]